MKMNVFTRNFCLAASLMASSAMSAVAVKGTVQGFTDLRNNDDYVDGAIVIPSIRPSQLLSLQLDGLIAPNEPMEAGPTTIQIPGNLFFPTQNEKYGFFGVTISKTSFTHMATPGASNELSALSFRAPFTQLVNMGQNKAPIIQMLSLVKFRNMAFESDRDWSQAPQPLRLTLNQAPINGVNFSWSRPAPQTGEMDLVVNFQKTPSNRWLVADFVGNKTNGSLAQYAALNPEFKVAFVRTYPSADVNDQVPVAATGYFRNAIANTSVSVDSVPAKFSNVSASGTHIQWAPITQPGWIAILRTPTSTAALIDANHPFRGLAFGLADLASKMPQLPSQIEAWANPSTGAFELSSPLGASKVTLVFIGTDRPVPAPETTLSDAEPPIFTYANEFKFVRIP